MSDAVVCTNIGRKGRVVRTRMGLVQIAVTLLLVGLGAALGWAWWWRCLAALPATSAASALVR